MQVNQTTAQRIQDRRRFQSKPYSQQNQRQKSHEFTSIQIGHSTYIGGFWHTMYYTSISPHRISRLKNHCNTRTRQPQEIIIEYTTQTQEFRQEVRCQWHGHITQTKNKKHNTEQRHPSLSSSQIFQSFGMSTIINLCYTQKQCWALNSVCKHQKRTSNQTHSTSGKQSQSHHAHVSYTTILNQFFEINLTQGCKRPINQPKQTNGQYEWPVIRTSFRKEPEIKSQQSISSQFQQYSSQQYTPCCTLFYVSFRQPQMQRYHRNFHLKSQKQTPPEDQLFAKGPIFMHQKQKTGGPYQTKHHQHTRKHCQTPNQSVQDQKVLLAHFTRTRPSQANGQKHRQQTTFVQNVKTQQIQTGKPSKQTTFKNQQNTHKAFGSIIWQILPATKNCDRHQNPCQQNHPQTELIHTKFKTHVNQTFPALGETHHMAKRFGAYWSISSPKHYTQDKCNQGKQQTNHSNQLIICSRDQPNTKPPKCWQKQNIPQQVRNCKTAQKYGTQSTTPQYLKLHSLAHQPNARR